ncbi:MAG: tryptophan--tRNA ligase [Tistrella sp.]|jgi:tryptophanyl-tRNA synthetase|uniref:Tryptophan--tRNA ligase n=2 Tax=Tistrella mobilis TaxID=171437 RepID=I3TRG2_TISMK|nr:MULTISPECIES: tryptophan--tRNA ligase [Tistrella]AFK55350.1 Tryptophanyl-tRNA synthetase [Tistrella mobilis KA081020-065]KYO52538.1 tryptophan--tRNA ligase [Tistrella mobilis]MAD36390.1 tryptophan--tRNA ligase [Tistrella sp.]MAM75094.1 tryptophan--tRNA ligase [Tistrella sp.]MBA78287.1 tryptophan--tRNA ligase [Tistrella sp.]
MARIFSGAQPTGNLHLGNYLGAIRNWVTLQDSYESVFCIVDLHAITVWQDPKALIRQTRELTAAYIAAGIDPERCVIFNQSAVTAHSELAWLLNCMTPIGWLNRMTQFKEKAGKDREKASLGLYAYPVLMAADILAYKATHVPVGEDQKQHLELTRDIAQRFNQLYEKDVLPLPEPMILGAATRVMSLRDGTKKMSKSDPSDYARINLTDDRDTIAQKLKKARTDSEPGVTYEPERRPEVANLIRIYAALDGRTTDQVVADYADAPFTTVKTRLTDLAVEKLGPIAEEMKRLMADPAEIDRILAKGADRARAIADPVVAEVRETIGLLRP